MKKLFTLSLLTLLVISSLGMISAQTSQTTLVAGTIYNQFGEIITGAFVSVSCDNGDAVITKNTTSSVEGTYAVSFNENNGPNGCNDGDIVTVTATDEDLSGVNTGVVLNNMVGNLDIAIVNVVIVPEFGAIVGILTLFGAISVFFVARRE
jgi:translation initiation factor IF-1